MCLFKDKNWIRHIHFYDRFVDMDNCYFGVLESESQARNLLGWILFSLYNF